MAILHRIGEHEAVRWGDMDPSGYGSTWDIASGVEGLDACSFALRTLDRDGRGIESWKLPPALGAAIKAAREGLKPSRG